MKSVDSSEKVYWEEHYENIMRKTETKQKQNVNQAFTIKRDDYVSYDDLKEVIHIYLSEAKSDRILILGNGLSRLQSSYGEMAGSI